MSERRNLSFSWSEDVTAKAQMLWREGLSAAAIATRIGTSRSAVCGFAKRNRDRFPQRINSIGQRVTKSKPGKTNPTKVEAKKPRRSVRQPARQSIRLPWANPLALADRPAASTRDLSRYHIAGLTPVAFADLANDQCRFPLEAFERVSGPVSPCCGGRTAEGASYCAAHYRLMRGRST